MVVAQHERTSLVYFAAVTAFLLLLFPALISADLASRIEDLTQARTKIVWAKGVTSTYESDVYSSSYALMGYDTREGFPREIVSGPVSCANPWITPDGARVIYNDWPDTTVYIVDWSGENKQELLKGFALSVWEDPSTGQQWVYASDVPYGTVVRRYLINAPDEGELVWNKSKVSIRFRVSADGTRGGGEFPWPQAGVVTLPNGDFEAYGSGCNSMIAPDNSYRFFHLMGGHRKILMYDDGGENSRAITIDEAPGLDGQGAWIPKWSSDVRFLTVAGPHNNPEKLHDIYLGRFDEDFNSVDSWVQVTSTPDTFDCYAYAWLAPGSPLSINPPYLDFSLDENATGNTVGAVRVTCDSSAIDSLKVFSSAPWLTVSATGPSCSWKITNKVDPSDLLSGLYSATVTIEGLGLMPQTYVVGLRIAGPSELHSVVVSPARGVLRQGDSLQFLARGMDQFGDYSPLDVQWEVSGGGTISSEGHFVSAGDTGSFFVTAEALSRPSLIDTARLSIYEGLSVSAPRDGETYTVGDTLRVKWRNHVPGLQGVAIEMSPWSGRKWVLLNDEGAITPADTGSWGNYQWVISDSLYDFEHDTIVSTITEQGKIRVRNYDKNAPGSAVSEGVFSIVAGSGSYVENRQQPPDMISAKIVYRNGNLLVDAGHGRRASRIALYDCRGKLLATAHSKRFFSTASFSAPGIYLIVISNGGSDLVRRITLHP